MTELNQNPHTHKENIGIMQQNGTESQYKKRGQNKKIVDYLLLIGKKTLLHQIKTKKKFNGYKKN